MKVKMCGIDNVEDAKRISDYGPDAIGMCLLLYGDDTPADKLARAGDIVRVVPRNISTFLLTRSKDPHEILTMKSSVQNSHFQLKEDVSEKDLYSIKETAPDIKLVKVIYVAGDSDVDKALKYASCEAVDELLLDSKTDKQSGGTGVKHDWRLSRMIVESSRKPVWLAGGLKTDGDIRNAIETVNPYGLDFYSGIRNPDKITINYDRARSIIELIRKYQ